MGLGAATGIDVYKGWVPNLDGSTSFSTFGIGLSDIGVVTENVGDTNNRYVISYQRKVLRDAIFPPTERLSKYLNSDGAFHLICIAKSVGRGGTGSNTLRGVLCLVQGDDWRDECMNQIRHAQQKLKSCQIDFPQLDNSDYVADKAGACFSVVEEAVRKYADFACEFSLEKSGIATIDVPTTWRWYSERMSESVRKRQRFIVSSQLFYFLKNLGHRHQHHSRRTDTICDLYPVGDDVKWKYETFRRLYLKMAEYEFRKNEEVYFSSLGVLSYLRSFHRIVGRDLERYDLVDRAIVPLPNMELSITANQQTISRKLQEENTSAQNFMGWVFGTFGAILSFLSLSQMVDHGVVLREKVARVIEALDYFALETPEYFVTTTGVFILACWLVVYRRSLYMESEAIFTAMRALNPLPRSLAAIVPATLGLLICFGIYFVGKAYQTW